MSSAGRMRRELSPAFRDGALFATGQTLHGGERHCARQRRDRIEHGPERYVVDVDPITAERLEILGPIYVCDLALSAASSRTPSRQAHLPLELGGTWAHVP